MKIIDAHVHIFDVLKGFHGKGELTPIGKGKARWATGEIINMLPEGLGNTSFTADTCYRLLKENGVERAVLLQGSFYGFQNEYIAHAAERYPDMFLAAGTFDPMGIYAGQIYEYLTTELHMKVMKFETSEGCGLMSYHSEFNLSDVFMPIARECRKNGQTLVFDIGSPGMSSFQPDEISRIAKKYQDLKIIICHLMAPTLEDEAVFKESLEILAGQNVYFDLAAVPHNVQPEVYPYPSGVKYIKMARDIVGYDKLLWGTDIPSVLCEDTYENLIKYINQTGEFTKKELEAIFYGNAMEAYPFE